MSGATSAANGTMADYFPDGGGGTNDSDSDFMDNVSNTEEEAGASGVYAALLWAWAWRNGAVLTALLAAPWVYDFGTPWFRYALKMATFYAWVSAVATLVAIPVGMWRPGDTANAEAPLRVMKGFTKVIGFEVRVVGQERISRRRRSLEIRYSSDIVSAGEETSKGEDKGGTSSDKATETKEVPSPLETPEPSEEDEATAAERESSSKTVSLGPSTLLEEEQAGVPTPTTTPETAWTPVKLGPSPLATTLERQVRQVANKKEGISAQSSHDAAAPAPSQQGSAAASAQGSAHGSAHGSAQGLAHESAQGSAHGSAHSIPSSSQNGSGGEKTSAHSSDAGRSPSSAAAAAATDEPSIRLKTPDEDALRPSLKIQSKEKDRDVARIQSGIGIADDEDEGNDADDEEESKEESDKKAKSGGNSGKSERKTSNVELRRSSEKVLLHLVETSDSMNRPVGPHGHSLTFGGGGAGRPMLAAAEKDEEETQEEPRLPPRLSSDGRPLPSYVVVVNHQHAVDVLVLLDLWPHIGHAAPLAKWELLLAGPFGLASYLCGIVFINRAAGADARKILVDRVRRAKDEGVSVVVFPEGTRFHERGNRDMLPFKKGAFRAALGAGVPILPIVISHYDFIDTSVGEFGTGHVTATILEPIPVEEKEFESDEAEEAEVLRLADLTRDVMLEHYRKT